MRRGLRLLPHAWALAVGTAVAVQVQQSPFGTRPIVDERMYLEWAKRIASGELLGHDVFFFDPLWAYVLGGLLVLTKSSLLACRLFGVLLFAGTVELVYRTAEKLFSGKVALGAAACIALYGPLAFSTGFLLKEPLTVHLAAWAALALAHAEGRRWLRLKEARREAGVVLAGLLLAWLPTPVSAQRSWHEAQCVGSAGLQLQADGDPGAQRWLDEATKLAPERWPAEARARAERAQ